MLQRGYAVTTVADACPFEAPGDLMEIVAGSKEFGGEHIGNGGGSLLTSPGHDGHDRRAGGRVGHDGLDDSDGFGKRVRRIPWITKTHRCLSSQMSSPYGRIV
jgi:hypothetical protein